MHDIWNPWHGCVKCSEGCAHCYMYYLDRMRGANGAAIYKTKVGFTYPLQKDRRGRYKVRSGEHIRVCITWKKPTPGVTKRGTSSIADRTWCFSF